MPRKLGGNLSVLSECHHLFDAFRSFIYRGRGALNGPFSSFHPIVLKIGVVVRGETISTAETEEFFWRTISVGFFPLETLQEKISRLSPLFLFDGIVVQFLLCIVLYESHRSQTDQHSTFSLVYDFSNTRLTFDYQKKYFSLQ